MEKSGCTLGFNWFCLVFLLIICGTNAENHTDPTDNLSLTSFSQWRNAYYCLQNVPTYCQKYALTLGGRLNISHSDTQDFCTGGCADHTRAVLACIHYVKPDFWFANKARVGDLNKTINDGCNTSHGFNGTSLYLRSSGSQTVSASTISTLSALVFITLALVYM